MHRFILSLIKRTADAMFFRDAHPDAVACRLRLALVCQQACMEAPWNVEEDLGAYTQTLVHVSAGCKLDPSEEKMITKNKTRLNYLDLLEQSKTDPSSVAQFELPRVEAKEIGGMLKQLASVAQQVANQDFVKGLKDDKDDTVEFGIKYKRPTSDAELVGAGAIQTLSNFWRDELTGRVHGCGFGLIYDMLVGGIDLHITDESPSGECRVMDADSDSGPNPATLSLIELADSHLNVQLEPEVAAFVLRRVRGNMSQAIEFLKKQDGDMGMIENEDAKLESEAIDEKEEGPRRVHSCCKTLGKLMLHGQFIKLMLDATTEPKKNYAKDLQKHLVALATLAPLVAVTDSNNSTLDYPFQYPSFPYSKVRPCNLYTSCVEANIIPLLSCCT